MTVKVVDPYKPLYDVVDLVVSRIQVKSLNKYISYEDNELTHQRLTDIGRAPAFYDCLVQVQPG